MEQENKDIIQNYEVERDFEDFAMLGGVIVPARFKSNVANGAKMEDIVKQLAERKIPTTGRELEEKYGRDDLWAGFDPQHAKIPLNNYVVDEDNGLAGFVLVNETPVIGGQNIDEGIYGLRKNGNEVKGRLFTYDKLRKNGPDNYFRHMVDGIEDGVLKARIVRGDREDRENYDLQKL